jgi:hypothetical protein
MDYFLDEGIRYYDWLSNFDRLICGGKYVFFERHLEWNNVNTKFEENP